MEATRSGMRISAFQARQQVSTIASYAGQDRLVRGPDAQAELVLAQVLPDVFDRVQLRRVGWQGQQGEVVRDDQGCSTVPAGPVQHQDGVGTGRDLPADLLQMQAHRLRVGRRQHQPGADGPLRTDRAEQTAPNR
jgi:hypothetical protein